MQSLLNGFVQATIKTPAQLLEFFCAQSSTLIWAIVWANFSNSSDPSTSNDSWPIQSPTCSVFMEIAPTNGDITCYTRRSRVSAFFAVTKVPDGLANFTITVSASLNSVDNSSHFHRFTSAPCYAQSGIEVETSLFGSRPSWESGFCSSFTRL